MQKKQKTIIPLSSLLFDERYAKYMQEIRKTLLFYLQLTDSNKLAKLLKVVLRRKQIRENYQVLRKTRVQREGMIIKKICTCDK